jgi:branched-chain amino acid transport system permease protein
MTEWLQLTFAGLALGVRYSLVALGLVVVFSAMRVVNLSHVGAVVLGAYLTYNAHVTWGLPFGIALLVAMLIAALVGWALQRVVFDRLVGRPVLAVTMTTVGVLVVVNQVVTRIWGFSQLGIDDPWGIDTVEIGGVVMLTKDLWTLALAGVALVAFTVFLRRSRMGLALRAVAVDVEAAAASGMKPTVVFGMAWAIAGATAALAGTMIAAGPGGVHLGIETVAIAALPAMIVGGLDSPLGAVIGGLLIGVVQLWTAGYQPDVAPWLGRDFDTVMPYVVMVVILLIRPTGLFGTAAGRRV